MVLLDPKANARRLWLERLIWMLDLSAYGFLGAAGWAAAFDPSDYVVRTMQGMSWVIWLWGWMLLTGGIFSLVGRASRLWVIEYAFNVLAAWGAFLYLLILFPALTSGGSFALAAVVYVSWAFVMRRHLELNIITSDPRRTNLRQRIHEAMRRRTQNTVPRLRD